MRALVCQTQDLCPLGTLDGPLQAAGFAPFTWFAGAEPPPATLDGFAALLALGGAANPDDDERFPWLEQQRNVLREALERRLPTLGICLGAQLLAQVGGGEVHQLAQPEIGWVELSATPAGRDDPLYGLMPARRRVLSWHSYAFMPPPGARLLSGSPAAAQACRFGDGAWALQYHLEANETIAASWVEHYESELRATGPPPELLARDNARFAATQERFATAFASGFARFAAERSRGGST